MPEGARGGCSTLLRVEQSRGRRRPGRVPSFGRRSPEAVLGRGGGRSEEEGPGGEPQVLEDGLGGGGAEDDGDDAPDAAAALAVEDICPERPLQELRPRDAGRGRRPGPVEHAALGRPRCGGRERRGCARHDARNALVVCTADALIALGGEFGTLSEIALALKAGKPVVGLDTWELARRGQPATEIVRASSPVEAVERALALALRASSSARPGAPR